MVVGKSERDKKLNKVTSSVCLCIDLHCSVQEVRSQLATCTQTYSHPHAPAITAPPE
ncbi:hypothetical protein JOB18_014629 [Solea senegalensis]|uniref:Uncharacterized protein n=1 Tax=Solea senegalensis TaxID=28829 RepID=A0AAV6SRS2_SOLSE|nr:hypothetical protein JOB18_014629 [Solea senegalensis]